MHGSDFFILATYTFQIILICFLPVPSAGSTVEMLSKVRRDNSFALNHPAKSAVQSTPLMIAAITATLLVTGTSLIPLITIIFPQVVDYLFPFMKVLPNTLIFISMLLLIIGNVLTFVAVRTLRSHVTFHGFGETTRLHMSGIYGYMRNPITVGLAGIYTGFLLALPSAVMLVGFIVFLFNSACRVRMEEVYLERTFGDKYQGYKNRVGKYFPRLRLGKVAPWGQ
jgi:protein-S-isoprenylcysteine O-methyltransferase Ste14